MAHSIDHAGPANPLTLAIDVGGSHLKAAVLNAQERCLQVHCASRPRSRRRRA